MWTAGTRGGVAIDTRIENPRVGGSIPSLGTKKPLLAGFFVLKARASRRLSCLLLFLVSTLVPACGLHPAPHQGRAEPTGTAGQSYKGP
jgi:hypothetical protein